ncbi:MAG: preprotein translocase subunit SecG [Proteobacteria bacterium]|nr:preprotein translocase subunit SecG [Pseudomonadota bacterium]
MLQNGILILHVFVAASLIGLVLLQRGKGAEAGAAFGAGASGTVFGAQGSANFLSHTTAVLAAVFFMTSLTLAYFSSQTTEPLSILEQEISSERALSDEPVEMFPVEQPGDSLPALPEMEDGDEAPVPPDPEDAG